MGPQARRSIYFLLPTGRSDLRAWGKSFSAANPIRSSLSICNSAQACLPLRRQRDAPKPSIIHTHEIEPFRRSNRAAAASVTRGERIGDVLRIPFPFADKFQRSDKASHLVVKERARRGLDEYLVSDCADGEAIERLHGRFCLAFRCPERGEIVPPDKRLGGCIHGGSIKHAHHMPGASEIERQRRTTADNAIAIMP